MGTHILMRATSSGGVESALAQIDVPLDGNLVGINWAVGAVLNATEEFLIAEVSFGSAYVNSNDSRQVVGLVQLQAGVLTAVGAVVEYANVYAPAVLGVSMGERIYLHASGTAGVVGTIQAMLLFDFNLDRPAARRR